MCRIFSLVICLRSLEKANIIFISKFGERYYRTPYKPRTLITPGRISCNGCIRNISLDITNITNRPNGEVEFSEIARKKRRNERSLGKASDLFDSPLSGLVAYSVNRVKAFSYLNRCTEAFLRRHAYNLFTGEKGLFSTIQMASARRQDVCQKYSRYS